MGIPAPVPLVLKSPFWRKTLMRAQVLLMKFSRGLFSYQMLMVVRPLPTLETLSAQTRRHSDEKSAMLDLLVPIP